MTLRFGRMAPFAWLLALGSPLACGSTADVFGERPTIPESEMALRVAESLCDQRLACDCYPLSGPVGEDPEAATRAQCIESRRLEIEHWQTQMNPSLVYDGACLEARLEAMQSWGCDDFNRAWSSSGLGCEVGCRIYHGTRTRGEACADDGGDDCAQGLMCRQEIDPTTYESLGHRCIDPCVDGWIPCGQTLCSSAEGCTGAGCVPLPEIGESCDQHYSCEWPAVCDTSDGAPICAALGEDGAACAEVPGCLGSCVDGLCAPGRAHVCDWDPRDGD